jgi:tetratricopeptide (TPR) repeat protein
MNAARDGEDQLIGRLRAEVARHPPERRPVQRATAQFHLGIALTGRGRLAEAERALREAAALFAPSLPVEHAKAVNALGAVLRETGRPGDAAAAFAAAARAFSGQGLDAEEGAAVFNLGLARLAQRDLEAACDCFEHARGLLHAPPQAAAASRELGGALLAAGRVDDAIAALEEAVRLSDRARDLPGLGAAANALGLALLAAGRATDAVASLRSALGASPRSIRPESWAMVQANLALAYERTDEAARARVAARQALGTPDAPAAVRAQAAAAERRLGADAGDVLAVLAAEPREAWADVVRQELGWLLDAEPDARRRHAAAWARALGAGGEYATELAEAWLGAVLEVPPHGAEQAIRSLVEATATLEHERAEVARAAVRRALPRFHPPQWQRLEELFARVAGPA